MIARLLLYKLSQCCNEYKWSLIYASLGWWRGVTLALKKLIITHSAAICHQVSPTNLPVSAHDGSFAIYNVSFLGHSDG